MTTVALTRIDPADFAARRDAIAALDAAARALDGHEALGETVWRDLEHPAAGAAQVRDELEPEEVLPSELG